MKKILDYCKTLPQYVSRPWYPLAMALVAFSDYFIFIIPLDAMVVASIMAARKRWISISFWASLGSTLGAVIFAALIQHYGISFLESTAPNLLNDPLTQSITAWVNDYGFWAIVAIAATPIHQHPTVAIAALAKVPLWTIFLSMFLGRFIKYCVYTWLSTHAKKGLERFFRE